MRGWDGWAEELFRAGVELDLRVDEQADARFVAAEGDQPFLMAQVRPFPKGGYHEPLIELMALALPLGADRVGVGTTGRLSSLDDPVPPVIDGVGDLRQRALVVELVDGHRGPATNRSVIIPFDLRGDEVVWSERLEPGPAEGWIAEALAVLVDQRDQIRTVDVRHQLQRCMALGHGIALSDELADSFGIPAVPLA